MKDDEAKFNMSPKGLGDESAITQLNLCAVYSSRSQHSKAINSVSSAIDKLEKEIEFLKGQLFQRQLVFLKTDKDKA